MGNSVSILDTWTLKEGRAFSLLTELVMLLSILKYDLLQADRVRVSERRSANLPVRDLFWNVDRHQRPLSQSHL